MNAQGKRKSLTADSSPVNSVGKVFAGHGVLYLKFQVVITSFCEIIYSYNYFIITYYYHHNYLSSHLFHVESLTIVVPDT